MQSLDEGLAVLLAAGGPVQGVVSREQQLEDFTRAGERPVCRQEDVYVSGLQLAVVVRQTFDQPLHRAGLQETHSHRLPFQMWNLVVRILENRNEYISWILKLLTKNKRTIYSAEHFSNVAATLQCYCAGMCCMDAFVPDSFK